MAMFRPASSKHEANVSRNRECLSVEAFMFDASALFRARRRILLNDLPSRRSRHGDHPSDRLALGRSSAAPHSDQERW